MEETERSVAQTVWKEVKSIEWILLLKEDQQQWFDKIFLDFLYWSNCRKKLGVMQKLEESTIPQQK